jgi:hypothetical protein
MEESIQDLKRCIKQYKSVDDDIRIMNGMLYEKRESRKIIEMEMADIIKLPYFSSYDKLKIEDDNSTIKIQRPQTYSKPWSLSKKDLQNMLKDYFNSTTSPNADDCFKYISELRKSQLLGDEIVFSRFVPEEETS